MSVRDYEQAGDLIRKHPELLYCSKPCDEELITRAERALELNIPPLYRRFLSEFGFIKFGDVEIYGITDKNFTSIAEHHDLWQVIEHRKRGMAAHLILISFLGDGEYAAIDTHSSYKPDQCPIILFEPESHEPGGQFEILADDFGQFFRHQVVGALEIHKRRIAGKNHFVFWASSESYQPDPASRNWKASCAMCRSSCRKTCSSVIRSDRS